MAYFLVDCGYKKGMKGISHLNLTENDKVALFYRENTSRISIDLHKELEGIQAKKLYVKSETEKQDTVLLLSSYLGNCIQGNEKGKYYIISKDGIYDSVCRYWERQNVYVKRIKSISDYPQIIRQIN